MKQPAADAPRYIDTTYTGGAISMDSIAYIAEWIDGSWSGRTDKLGPWAQFGYCETGTEALNAVKEIVEKAWARQQTFRYKFQRFRWRLRFRKFS